MRIDHVALYCKDLEEMRNFFIVSGPRTTGDGYYETAFLGPEEIQMEITAD